MTDETYTEGWKWECPHCGEINTLDDDSFGNNEYGYEQCDHCESYAKLESTVKIEFMAAAIRKHEVADAKRLLDMDGVDVDADMIKRLAESIDDVDVKDDAEALKIATETPALPHA